MIIYALYKFTLEQRGLEQLAFEQREFCYLAGFFSETVSLEFLRGEYASRYNKPQLFQRHFPISSLIRRKTKIITHARVICELKLPLINGLL